MNPRPILSITEQHQLLDAMIVKNGTHKQFVRGLRNYTITLMMLETGLRIGEVLSLRKKDLYENNRPRKTINLPPELSKNHQSREIPISSRLSEALSTYAGYFTTLQDETHPCFYTTRKGNVQNLTVRQIERDINSAALRSLGRPINPHLLRHTFAAKAAQKLDPSDLQKILGHIHKSSTLCYYSQIRATSPTEPQDINASENPEAPECTHHTSERDSARQSEKYSNTIYTEPEEPSVEKLDQEQPAQIEPPPQPALTPPKPEAKPQSSGQSLHFPQHT